MAVENFVVEVKYLHHIMRYEVFALSKHVHLIQSYDFPQCRGHGGLGRKEAKEGEEERGKEREGWGGGGDHNEAVGSSGFCQLLLFSCAL